MAHLQHRSPVKRRTRAHDWRAVVAIAASAVTSVGCGNDANDGTTVAEECRSAIKEDKGQVVRTTSADGEDRCDVWLPGPADGLLAITHDACDEGEGVIVQLRRTDPGAAWQLVPVEAGGRPCTSPP
jgi:hypothetical protein